MSESVETTDAVQSPSLSGIEDFESTASEAYAAYGASTGGVNFQGNPMPKWDELPETIRKAWVAASVRVAEVLAAKRYSLADAIEPEAAAE